MNFKKIINNFKLKKIFLKEGINYNINMINAFCDKYIMHHKVINWYKWYPVYTTMVPPIFSDANAKFMWISMFGAIFNKEIPFYVNLALTDKCNASCPHCSFYWEDWVYDKNRKILKTSEFKSLVWNLQDLGTSLIWFVWGEPLMNEWFEDILKEIDYKKTSTLLFTNGFFLEEKLEMLDKNNLTSIAISIDSYDLDRHEELRWVKWLKDKILSAIKKVKKYDFTLAMSTYISPDHLEDFPKYMELAKKLGFHEVILFPSFPSWKLSKEKMYEDKIKFENLWKFIKMYNEDDSFPWIYWYSYVSSNKSIWCQGWKKYLYISPYWDVAHCDFFNKTYWNVLKENISDIFYKSSVKNKDVTSCSLITPTITKEQIEKAKKMFNT